MDKSKRLTFPHCDPKVIHAPLECEFCDNSIFQQIREAWIMNYTQKKQDPDKLPCPAVAFRGYKTSNAWHGNRAQWSDEFKESIAKILRKFGVK